MPRLTPVSRRELIQRLRRLGFEGLYTPELTGRDAERITLNGAIPSTRSGQAWG